MSLLTEQESWTRIHLAGGYGVQIENIVVHPK